MDIEEWELLPDDGGYLEIHDDGGCSNNKIFSRKHVADDDPTKHVFQLSDYFDISPRNRNNNIYFDPEKHSHHTGSVVPVPIPIQQNHNQSSDDHEDDSSSRRRRIIIKEAPFELDSVVLTPVITDDDDKMMTTIRSSPNHQDSVSQVFFKKENEFVDMKMDSPRSVSNSSNKGFVPSLDAAGTFQFEDKSEAEKENHMKEEDIIISCGGGGFKLWRWSLTGVGAICSFGVAAAATVCIIIFANSTHHHKNHLNQKLRFQIYSDDNKRIKQVVEHATKLNEAISMARGMPLTRAHFTTGGYYDGI